MKVGVKIATYAYPLNQNCCHALGVVGPSGTIRGCMEEMFDGITVRQYFRPSYEILTTCIQVNDQLREMLVNPDSERSYVFGEDAQREFIFRLFKLFCIGGSMCQPDTNLSR